MEFDDSGRIRRLLTLERGILVTVQWMLKTMNGTQIIEKKQEQLKLQNHLRERICNSLRTTTKSARLKLKSSKIISRQSSEPSIHKSSSSKSLKRSFTTTSPISNSDINTHHIWLYETIKTRDDAHLFLCCLLYMSMVHVTDSEKLNNVKTTFLQCLMEKCSWGQRTTITPPPMKSTTNSSRRSIRAAARSISQSPPASPISVPLSFKPPSSMLYQFDCICLDIVNRNLLPNFGDVDVMKELQKWKC
jgi:hypothetical protein